jgi:uncharacterized protein YecE (DUF72 family)
VPATIRIGVCSFADEGLLKAWYPREVSSPKARLAYYAERFDTVEVDSPFYHLPDPAVAGRWAQRTPPEFVFHVKAHKTMTHHDEAEQEQAFAEFRAALEPLELSGKLRSVLLQFHPRFVKSPEAKEELARARPFLEPLVPLVEFRHRSWLDDDNRAETLRWLEARGMTHVVVDAPKTEAKNLVPTVPALTSQTLYVRFHGRNEKTWNKRGGSAAERFDYLYSTKELEEWVEPLRELAGEAQNAYAFFNNNASSPGRGGGRVAQAPTNAAMLRRLLDSAGVPASGGLDPTAAAQRLF